jgi:Cu/Ag efflux protein CusF
MKMRKLVIPAAAIALMAATSFAFAADAKGTIKTIDTTKSMITLDNGSSYWAPASVKLSKFKVGQKVDVTYTMAKGKMEISTVKPAA